MQQLGAEPQPLAFRADLQLDQFPDRRVGDQFEQADRHAVMQYNAGTIQAQADARQVLALGRGQQVHGGGIHQQQPQMVLAQAVGLSPFHAARLFTRTNGMPPHAWRNQLRLQRALAPLLVPLHQALLQGMRSTGILAVALYTLRHQPARAREFWMGLAEHDGLRKNDPRATLYSDILTRTMATGSIRQRVQQPALAWNAFCEGRDLKIIKCIDGAALTLWGTPLAKGRAA